MPHTTRAALTGLRKKGHAVVRGKRGDQTCYSVAVTGAVKATAPGAPDASLCPHSPAPRQANGSVPRTKPSKFASLTARPACRTTPKNTLA
ncbi:hypothetical protein [Sphingomonas sp. RS2018]